MRLLTYINELLLLNDCVIVPGFGGFITNCKPATIRSSTFHPPASVVAFNKKLSFNDGLLVNYIAEKEGINYVSANQQLEMLVKEINYRLADGDRVTVEGVGELFYDEGDQLVFEPVVKNKLNLDSYGLANFHFETLYAKKISRIRQEDRDAVEVIFQKRGLKKVMVGIPLIIALAFFPIKNSTENILKSDLNILTEMTSPAEPAQQVEAVVEMQAGIEETQMEDKYFLIGGSFRNDENAERFLTQKLDEGFNAQNLGVIKGLNYIALASYPDFESAKAKKAEIRGKSPDSGVWIYVKD